ncbi:MAG: ATP phosphoribosyltransferase regulatory subunit, partial [Hydrogenoanaerobacterium sp.]
GELCQTCTERLVKNPMRILDCKNPDCAKLAAAAPRVLDYICDDCREHFEGVKKRLDALNIPYIVNASIVRGLDYYTKTVFEFVSENIGAQGTVCGGGRYDGLVEQLGGQVLAGVGFAMGIERLLSVMDKSGCEYPQQNSCAIYIGSIGEEASVKAFALTNALRQEGLYAQCDVSGRSVKAQMKYADKLGSRFSCILGDNELAEGKTTVKNMSSGKADKVSFNELAEYIYDNYAAVVAEENENA